MAAYHDQNCETTVEFYPAAERWQHRNQQKKYKLEGWYERPMGLHDIHRFERLNNCQDFLNQFITCLINGKHVMFFQEKHRKQKKLFSLHTKKENCCL